MVEPRMRAGDADRRRVVEQLGRHFAEGRLDVGEFDERVGRAHATVYLDEFPPLLADLPPEPAPQPVATRRAHQPARPLDWPARAAVAVVVGLLLTWSVIGMVHGIPPVFGVLLLAVFLRQRRWHRRW
jgi:Domain of unknown function (DUF1707)